ncbi:MAG: hypothetical protein ACLPN5_22880 [Roseiarcus sp.]
MANGFLLSLSTYQVQIQGPVGRWLHVVDHFVKVYVKQMRKYQKQHVVLLIDFDGDTERRAVIEKDIPTDLKDRVFILGALTEPEELRRAGLGTYEEIGKAMANDCCLGTLDNCGNDLLKHNIAELARLRKGVCPDLPPVE